MEPEPEFRFSIKETKLQVPEPVEGTDYFEEDKFDCIVAFEIHTIGYEEEDDTKIKIRAYEAIKEGGDLECLGVMTKEKVGTVSVDMGGKPFNRDAWIKQKTDDMKVIRKEKTITEFV